MSQTTVDPTEAPDRGPGDDDLSAGVIDVDARSAPPETPSADEQIAELRREIGRHDVGVGVLLGLAFVVMIASVIAIGLIQRNDDGGARQPYRARRSPPSCPSSRSRCPPRTSRRTARSPSPTPARMAHTVGVRGTDLITASIPPGGTATLDLTGLDPDAYTLFCDVPGHVESGMETPLTITDGTGTAGGDAAAMGMTAEEHAAMDHAAMTEKRAWRWTRR